MGDSSLIVGFMACAGIPIVLCLLVMGWELWRDYWYTQIQNMIAANHDVKKVNSLIAKQKATEYAIEGLLERVRHLERRRKAR
jgi:hypothetical protein